MFFLILSILSYVIKDTANHIFGMRMKVGVEEAVLQNSVAFTIAGIVCLPFCGEYSINLHIMKLALLFGLCYTATNIAVVLTFCHGPAGPSGLIGAFSSVGGLIFGVIFCNESLTLVKTLGIVVMFITVLLLKPGTKEEKKVLTLTWFMYAIAGALFNMCYTSVKKGIVYFNPDLNIKLITTLGLFSAAAICWIIVAARGFKAIKKIRDEKKMKTFCTYSVIPGIAVGGATMFQMLALTVLPTYIVYPFTTSGIPFVECFISLWMFKEIKFTKKISAALVLCVAGAFMITM